jgi:hypothetical protein
MSLKIEPANIIYDSTGEELFKFPLNTLLDGILPELWGVIVNYMNFPLFILSSVDVPCYSRLTKDNFDTYKEKFANYYFEKKELIWRGTNKYLSLVTIDGHKLKTNNGDEIHCENSYANIKLSICGCPLKKEFGMVVTNNIPCSHSMDIMIYEEYLNI